MPIGSARHGRSRSGSTPPTTVGRLRPAVATTVADADLASWPLPAEWVHDGTPDASGAVLSRSDDSRIVRGVWQCTPGRFHWVFSYDETLVVLSGRATVELDTGETVELA